MTIWQGFYCDKSVRLKEKNMSDYNRTTRECTVSQLHPELFLAVRNYFQEHQLGDLETDTLQCCETISRKKSANRLISWLNDSLDTTVHMGILFTSQWLIWVRSGDKSGTQLASANLTRISVRVYSSIFTKDAGLEIAGQVEDSKGMVRGVLAMESVAAAQKFFDEMNQAIIKVNPPAPKGLSKWWGGLK
jgi:hypothetical protein